MSSEVGYLFYLGYPNKIRIKILPFKVHGFESHLLNFICYINNSNTNYILTIKISEYNKFP